ncbi:MAG TPA: hypothetical protein VMW24_04210 [Sedimentisphaerales bacterium]|nr:hypothetical protein [Sedimentisphaerales bacterium]
MKARMQWILVIVVLCVLIAGVVVQAGKTRTLPTRKITDRFAFLEGVFFAQECQLQAQLRYETENILSGLQGVLVIVDGVNPQAAEYGLTKQALQTDTELRLRQHGIRVFTKQEWERSHTDSTAKYAEQNETFKRFLLDEIQEKSDEDFLQSLREYLPRSEDPAIAALHVSVSVLVDSEQRGLAFNIEIRLMEGAELRRTQKSFADGIVWESGSLLGTMPLTNVENVREHVRDKVDEFINAYLAANPTAGSRGASSTTGSTMNRVISGIVSSEDRFCALIGTAVVSEGDTIGGVKVVKIYKDKVEFEKDGKRWTQRLNEPPSPEWQ